MECDYAGSTTQRDDYIFGGLACHEEAIQFFMTSRNLYCRCARHILYDAEERTDVILLTKEEYEVAKIQTG